MSYWLKACPRCKGDLYEEWDLYDGKSISCIQCGHVLNRPEGEAILPLVRSAVSGISLRPDC